MSDPTQPRHAWTPYARGFAVLTVLFVTLVVLTNTVGAKLFEIGGRA